MVEYREFKTRGLEAFSLDQHAKQIAELGVSRFFRVETKWVT